MRVSNSKRIKAFRRELIAAVPRFPNDKASLQAMESKPLMDLFIIYIGWRLRYVAARPRKVTGRSNLTGDPRAAALQPNIDAFIAAVDAGNDLTPYLSLLPRTRGYTPSPVPATGTLSAVIHLGLTMEAAGHATRTD